MLKTINANIIKLLGDWSYFRVLHVQPKTVELIIFLLIFQLITLIHTVIQNDKLNTKRILVLCPKSTVMNWVDEIEKWTNGIRAKFAIEPYVFPDNS